MSQTPMDFAYDNGTGPLDGRSPFAQLGHNVQRFPASTTSSPSKRRAQNGTASPSKQRMMGALPSTPSRQQPAAFNSMFTTPRTSHQMDIDDSSAGETPRSPDRDADSEATPEIKNARSAKPRLDMDGAPAPGGAERSDRSSPTKDKQRPHAERRDSWLGNFMSKAKSKLNSPKHSSDIVLRADNAGRIEKSVSRRRKQEIDRAHRRKRRHSVSDSDCDGDSRPASSPRKGSQQGKTTAKEPHWMRVFFTFIADHPTVPQILSFYAQLAFNFFLLSLVAYLIWCFCSAVSSDVDKEAAKEIAEVIAQQARCVKDWQENRCDPETRVRQLESFCAEKERCMNQDPYKVGRARVSAHTFAGIFNSFVEPISFKAMAFTLILVFGCFAISNLAFNVVRDKANQYQQGPYQQQHFVPPTPQRTFSGQDGGFYGQGTPWHQPYPGLEPQPSGSFGQIEGQDSPVRRLQY